jgi:hypothetical protein
MLLRRRGYGALVVVLAGCASLPGGGPDRKQATTRGDLSETEAVAHVLSRLTFGARPGDAERVREVGIENWIDGQLHPETIADSAMLVALKPVKVWTVPVAEMPAAVAAGTPRLVVPAIPRPPANAPDSVRARIAQEQQKLLANLVLVRPGGSSPFFAGKIIRAQTSERQLSEVMADFWENHFSVYTAKMPSPASLAEWSREQLRPRVLGKFRDLLGAVAHSPAMLFYLDNHLSRNGALNENYARELMELHTLGVDGGYTQQDVIEVARALTGWTLKAAEPFRANAPPPPSRAFTFDLSMHDPGPKRVLGRQMPAGRGIEDGEEVLDIVARHPSTARFIATKLARRFVSDSPPPALIERAAATFLKSDGDIAEVMRTIVTSPEFFSRDALRAKIKTPFEFVVSMRRALNVPVDTTVATAQSMTTMGQPMFGRQTPDGWPDIASAWINSGALMNRILFSADVAEGRAPTTSAAAWPGWALLRDAAPEKQVDGVVSMLLGGIVSQQTRKVMLTGSATGEPRLREIVAIALGSPEFQRR